MRISEVTRSPREEILVYDFQESYRLRKLSGGQTVETTEDAALQKVEEVKNKNTDTTLDMMDRHNEMVKKSQELYKAKARQRAIERQNIERREEQRELLAEMALRAQRDSLEFARIAKSK